MFGFQMAEFLPLFESNYRWAGGGGEKYFSSYSMGTLLVDPAAISLPNSDSFFYLADMKYDLELLSLASYSLTINELLAAKLPWRCEYKSLLLVF